MIKNGRQRCFVLSVFCHWISFRPFWPCVMNVGWRERETNKMQTNLMFIIKLLIINIRLVASCWFLSLHPTLNFLLKTSFPAADNHHRLQLVYGDVCTGASSVRWWVKHFKEGNTSIQDNPRSGRPRTASTEPNKKRVGEIIKEDRRVTLDAITTKLGIGHNTVQEMIGSLDYRKKGYPAAR